MDFKDINNSNNSAAPRAPQLQTQPQAAPSGTSDLAYFPKKFSTYCPWQEIPIKERKTNPLTNLAAPSGATQLQTQPQAATSTTSDLACLPKTIPTHCLWQETPLKKRKRKTRAQRTLARKALGVEANAKTANDGNAGPVSASQADTKPTSASVCCDIQTQAVDGTDNYGEVAGNNVQAQPPTLPQVCQEGVNSPGKRMRTKPRWPKANRETASPPLIEVETAPVEPTSDLLARPITIPTYCLWQEIPIKERKSNPLTNLATPNAVPRLPTMQPQAAPSATSDLACLPKILPTHCVWQETVVKKSKKMKRAERALAKKAAESTQSANTTAQVEPVKKAPGTTPPSTVNYAKAVWVETAALDPVEKAGNPIPTEAGEKKQKPRGKRAGESITADATAKRIRPDDSLSLEDSGKSAKTAAQDRQANSADIQQFHKLRVAVFAEPWRDLTAEETSFVEEALEDAIAVECHDPNVERLPSFRGRPLHTDGALKLWCEDDFTLEWLRRTAETINLPGDKTKLTIKSQTEMMAIKKQSENRVKAGMFIPNYQGETVAYLLTMLRLSNLWYNIDQWTVYNTELQEAKGGIFFTLGIPQTEVPKLMARDRRVSYKTGSAYVLLSKEIDAKPTTSKTTNTTDLLNAPQVMDISSKYSDKLLKKVLEHISCLDSSASEGESAEAAARKAVRAQLKKMTPYLPMIMKHMINKQFVTRKNDSKFIIYGEPDLPKMASLATFLRGFRVKETSLWRSRYAFNAVRLNAPPAQAHELLKADGAILDDMKLIIRKMSDGENYKMDSELKSKVKEAYGDTPEN